MGRFMSDRMTPNSAIDSDTYSAPLERALISARHRER
jgi:hypothetical protein